jgi:DNA-binding MarR family transcriptional regulator
MPSRMIASRAEQELLQVLAEFRYQLRAFLQFSERAAEEAGLHPQQHQLLLQVAGAPQGVAVNIAYAAKRLGLHHNSAVELVNRSVAQGLLVRAADAGDGRRVALEITAKGSKILQGLSKSHARELRELGPVLIRSLKRIERADRTRKRRRDR